MAIYRKRTPQGKTIRAALDGLKGRSPQEICAEYGISSTQYYRWRDEALDAIKATFENKHLKNTQNPHEMERNRLLKIIGEQHLIIDIQKKFSNSF